MKTKKKSVILRILLKLLILAAGAGLLFICYKCIICGHTMPIESDNGIAEYMTVELGGVQQSILIRGQNKDNPVLLYLHGGPGNPETSFIVPYQRELEKHFVVVNWDQRGSGRSYDSALTSEDLTTELICQDTMELTKYLEQLFHVDKIYLMAHSYGTLPGMLCISEYPEEFYAYIGMGQIGNQLDNEIYLQQYTYEQALADQNTKALEELENLEEGTYSRDRFGEELHIVRHWCNYYGGSIYGKKNADELSWKAIFGLEYSMGDLLNFVNGEKLYYTNTASDYARWELYTANLKEQVPKVEVPICFIQGEHDYCVTYQSCEEYFNILEAPYKELHKIEDCAHNSLYEKTSEVSQIIIGMIHNE